MKRLLLKRFYSIIIMIVVLFAWGTVLGSLQSCKEGLSDVPRISVEKARQKTISGESLLVCAYDDDESCSEIRLDRGISLKEFESKISDLSKEKEIIFFCA
jgi:hypothetical protein